MIFLVLLIYNGATTPEPKSLSGLSIERVCPALPVYLTANPFSPEPPKISERGLWQYKFS